MPSEVLKELLTCNGALKVCEFANESMEKTLKCWIKGAEEKEAEYETKVANLEFSVATLAQERVNNRSRLSAFSSIFEPLFRRKRKLKTSPQTSLQSSLYFLH